LYSLVFERYEIKYLITKKQYACIINHISKCLNEDKHGPSTIQSLYFDTKDNLLIRQSIDKPLYKEKLRLRSYGIANNDSNVFLEIKKKYKHKVYKRRIELKEKEAYIFLNQYKADNKSQIANEIAYMKYLYRDLEPKILMIYDRRAFYKDDLRITFDCNVRYRVKDLCLNKGLYGKKILDDDYILMEIKASSAMPLWLARLLSENNIFKTSFSKYKEAYKQELMEGDEEYVRINI